MDSTDIAYLEDCLEWDDHPIYLDIEDIIVLFDNLKLHWWEPSTGICSFCTDGANHFNKMTDLFTCDTCYADFESGEIDITNPCDHSISSKLRLIVCDWIDKHYFAESDCSHFLKNCKYNICDICKTIIDSNYKDNIAIADDARAIAHINCVQTTGFKNHYSQQHYDGIIEDLEIDKRIQKLNKSPKYYEKSVMKIL